MTLARLFSAAFVLLAAVPASAHTGGGADAGLLQGFAHPAGGLDHLLAMVAVGLWAAQAGGRGVWAVPAAFMASMLAGGLMGMLGTSLPGIELGIGASVTVLGVLVALAVRARLWVGMAVVSAFALFHGHAHGAEMPDAASPALYALGFLVATGALHASGIVAVLAANRVLVRLAGGAVAASGAALMVL